MEDALRSVIDKASKVSKLIEKVFVECNGKG